jgi:catechol 2,3-dioxygenase-like lactoylglutathione lyase family enzyme
LCCAAFAQTADTPKVNWILNYPHAVIDLDKTVAFYRDVIGLEFNRPPADFPNPGVAKLVNSPGVKLRLAMFKVPGAKYNLELTQFSAADRKAAQPMLTDPGAASLEFRVRDIEPILAALKKSGAPVITRSGKPVRVDGPDDKSLSIMVRDPDGYPVEVIQAPPLADAPEGNVHGVTMELTVENLEATQKFYQEMMGFELKGDLKFSKSAAVAALIGAPAETEFRELDGVVPGTAARISFYEYKGVPRKKFHLRVFDPGAPALVIRVTDLDAMLARLKTIGTEVLSAEGKTVQFGPTVRNIFVVDPNGLNLELYEDTSKR